MTGAAPWWGLGLNLRARHEWAFTRVTLAPPELAPARSAHLRDVAEGMWPGRSGLKPFICHCQLCAREAAGRLSALSLGFSSFKEGPVHRTVRLSRA